MKIKSVSVSCLRAYADPTKVEVGDLCALVGKNDTGKSTILEALDVFFNDNKGCIKLDTDDINRQERNDGRECVEIAVEFEDLPPSIVIDATNPTTLEAEHLLTKMGTLYVIKRYPKAGKAQVFIRALHPTHPTCSDLLQCTNKQLKDRLDEQGLHCEDKSRNADLRQAIWGGQDDLQLAEFDIEVAKSDAKSIWDQLRSYMPLYTLFQSDRKNSDGDAEVQDPMRIAVKEILGDPQIKEALSGIATTVKERLDEVANRTLEKLREMNAAIATSLTPTIPEPSDLKWADVFKNVSIAGDDEIPINKRGSGVKRLILINFFRAEAERRQQAEYLPSVVYAIEEPETSQHPEHQRLLIDALIALARADNSQVLLTTHSPEVVRRLAFENIRLVTDTPKQIIRVQEHELPYPSLNEVNYLAFDEPSWEYHNELYGFIQAEDSLPQYSADKTKRDYCKLGNNGHLTKQSVTLTGYIRHQIHHPENDNNTRFTDEELRSSIGDMRMFIQQHLR